MKNSSAFLTDGKNTENGNSVHDNKERIRALEKFIHAGIAIPCPDSVIISPDCIIGKGTVILPSTIIRSGCKIGSDCIIGPSTVLYKVRVGSETTLNSVQAHECEIGSNVTAGPFVHVRPGSIISDDVHIGNFVEVKNSVIGKSTHISHLTYVGDSDVGNGVNFGCGVVTVNFNGREKNRCTIGNDAFIGCNTNLIAPVKIGERAYTAAGSTITDDVPADALAIARSRQQNKENWVTVKKPYREKN